LAAIVCAPKTAQPGFQVTKAGYRLPLFKVEIGYRLQSSEAAILFTLPFFHQVNNIPSPNREGPCHRRYARKRQGELSDEDGTVTMIAQDRSTWEEAQGGRSMRMLNHGIRQFSARNSNPSISLDKMSH
jgi:hypothetical protein